MNCVYNENCLLTMDFMPENYIDLVVTSPPYDAMRKYNGYVFDFESIAKELFRTIKKGGIVVWVVGDRTHKGSESGTSFKQALYFKEIGFLLHDTMIYMKDSISFPETNRYSQVFEYMFVFSKGVPETTNIIKDRVNKWHGTKLIKGRERQTNGELVQKRKGNALKEFGSRFNVWQINTGYMKSSKFKDAFNHPAIFPEKLAEDHILSWSNEGDLVYDPFAGSGTTLISAKKLNRNYIGSEISAEYCKIINNRLSA